MVVFHKKIKSFRPLKQNGGYTDDIPMDKLSYTHFILKLINAYVYR